MSCVGSMAANRSPTRPLPPKRRSPTKLRSDVFDTKALRRCRRAFFVFFALTISPPLRFGPALCPVAEGALGRQVSEHQRDGSATIQVQIHHHRAPPVPHHSVGSPGACVTDCSCPQEDPKLSNLLEYRMSISHMPYGEDTDRRSRKCSSRARDRRTSTLHPH